MGVRPQSMLKCKLNEKGEMLSPPQSMNCMSAMSFQPLSIL